MWSWDLIYDDKLGLADSLVPLRMKKCFAHQNVPKIIIFAVCANEVK